MNRFGGISDEYEIHCSMIDGTTGGRRDSAARRVLCRAAYDNARWPRVSARIEHVTTSSAHGPLLQRDQRYFNETSGPQVDVMTIPRCRRSTVSRRGRGSSVLCDTVRQAR